MLRGLVYRVVGAPPASGATRAERLRWVRKFYRLSLASIMVLVIFALTSKGTFLWIGAAVLAVFWVCGLASISMSINRERSRGR